MKTFFIYITPIVIACFLCATTDSLCYAQSLGGTNTVVVTKTTPKNLTPVDYSTVTATNLVLTYSTDLQNWGYTADTNQVVITNIDLSTAVLNTNTGMKEIYVTVRIAGIGVGLTNMPPHAFFKTDVVYTTDTGSITNTPDSITILCGNDMPPNILSHANSVPVVKIIGPNLTAPTACAGIIIAIMVIVVMGIIIYILVKTCNKLLPKK